MSRIARARRRTPSALALWARLRALSAFALLLLIGQHALPALHHAAEAHEVCPEHGELVHGGEGAHPQSPPLQGRGISRGAEHAAHGHCGIALAVQHQEPALAAPGPAGLAAPGTQSVQAPAALGVSRAKSALFRLAPKQSPPI